MLNDRQPLEELAGPISLGLLAEEVVLAVGRVLRDEDLGPRERQAIEQAKGFLKDLGTSSNDLIGPTALRQMDSDQTYLDAFRAVRLHAPGEPVKDYLAKLEQTLGKALAGSLAPEDRGTCLDVQKLFTRLGEVTLARTSGFFEHSKEDPFSWMRIHKKSNS